MVGERYGYSIDIGKELEKEDSQEPKKEAVPKEESQDEEKPSEKELAIEEQEIQDQILVTDSLKPAKKEPAEDKLFEEYEESSEPIRPPDPIEDDVNEIITKHGPLSNDKKSFFRKLFSSPVLLFLLGIVIIGGWFVAKNAYTPEEIQPVILPSIEPIVLDSVEQISLAPLNMTESISNVEELPGFLADALRD